MNLVASLSSLRANIRIRLRIILGKTPPQTEKGWTKLTKAKPASADGDYKELVEVYKNSDDSLFRAYVWSLQNIPESDAAHYYWRKIEPEDAADRGFSYFSRSLSILG